MPVWFRLLYRLLWILAMPFALARLWWKGRLNAAYRENWRERLALAPPAGPFDVWIHAVSVGEARAMMPLANAFLAQNKRLLVTCTTPTGRATIASLLGEKAQIAYLPFDAPDEVERFLRVTRPALGLLIETELWPGVCDAARRVGIPLWLVNARLSERSAAGYAKGGRLTRAMLACLAGIATQTQEHADRFKALGATNVHVTGNMKFDLDVPTTAREASEKLAAHLVGKGAEGRAFWVAGSTREGEEALLLDALKTHALRHQAVVVIVPRHPERWGATYDSARERGFRVARRTDATIPAEAEVIVGDSMGEMLAYYGHAKSVVMGGTLGGTGGQNLIEPCAMGVPVVLGPSVFNFQQAADEAVAADAAVRVAHADGALDAVLVWMNDAAARDVAGANAMKFVDAHRGATGRTLGLLNP
ncbi:MAG: 3-deoxy-D-manno-octulosonic acid transferase [Burkholderiales bacterium]|nr:3-deoxy-D-manno-octulosonic acid transferase [Burkholderiales bacterium]